MRDCVEELADVLLNKGDGMRTKEPQEAPTSLGSPQGRECRSGAEGTSTSPVLPGRDHCQTPRVSPRDKSTASMQREELGSLLKGQPWRPHQPVATAAHKRGGCGCWYSNCPRGSREWSNGAKRAYPKIYRCHGCSVGGGTNVWLCNTTKVGGDHGAMGPLAYHATWGTTTSRWGGGGGGG